jgi:hypothetical protein
MGNVYAPYTRGTDVAARLQIRGISAVDSRSTGGCALFEKADSGAWIGLNPRQQTQTLASGSGRSQGSGYELERTLKTVTGFCINVLVVEGVTSMSHYGVEIETFSVDSFHVLLLAGMTHRLNKAEAHYEGESTVPRSYLRSQALIKDRGRAKMYVALVSKLTASETHRIAMC